VPGTPLFGLGKYGNSMGILWENDENMIEMMGKFYGF
jgi:hypothetical protein